MQGVIDAKKDFEISKLIFLSSKASWSFISLKKKAGFLRFGINRKKMYYLPSNLFFLEDVEEVSDVENLKVNIYNFIHWSILIEVLEVQNCLKKIRASSRTAADASWGRNQLGDLICEEQFFEHK